MRGCDRGCWCDYLSSQTELQSSKQAPTTPRREKDLHPTTTFGKKKANLNNWTDLFIFEDDSKGELWLHSSRPKGRLLQMKQRASKILGGFSRFSGIKFCESQIPNGSFSGIYRSVLWRQDIFFRLFLFLMVPICQTMVDKRTKTRFLWSF